MVERSGVGNTGTLMEVMKAAERIHCSYLNVYPEDVLKGTKGNADYDPDFEEALKYGASIIGKPVTIPSGIDSLFGRKIFTYEQSYDLRKLETLYEKSQEKKNRKGRFINYIKAETDGSIQPVGMYVPKDYTASKKYPLVLQLHGIGPKFIGGVRASWAGMKDEDWIDPSLGVIYVQAYARQNSGYRGIAESELLQILREVKQNYSIDTDRVYIIGHSMGGAGTLNFALHHPDMFAACTAIDAALGAADLNEDSTLPWLSFQSTAFNPDSVAMNAYNLPIFFHTADGPLKAAQYRLSGIMKQNGCKNVSIETHKGMPHHFAKFIPYHTFIQEMLKYKRNYNPMQIKFKTYSLKYNKAYWLTIGDFKRRNRPVSVDAEKNSNEISITTSNVSSLKLELFPNEKVMSIAIDGSKLKVAVGVSEIFLKNESKKWKIVKSLPTMMQTQSIGQVIEAPFLIVYGNDKDFELAHSSVDAIINPLGKRTVTVGDFPFKSYKELSPEDIKAYNLILFGTSESNPLIASCQSKLPLQINKDKVKMNGQTFKGTGVSAVFSAINPLNTSKSIVVWSGPLHNFKKIMDSSAFFMTILPEYIIFNRNEILKAGFYSEKLNN